jgi:hypothetical protein
MATSILEGQATGAPLFLAWSIGVLLAYPGMILVNLSTSPFYLLWAGFIGCLVFLSVWQAILLLPTWWRRTLWIAASFISVLSLVDLESFIGGSRSSWHYLSAAMVCQSLVLIGVRRRFGLWAALTILGNPEINKLGEPFYTLYDLFRSEMVRFVSDKYMLSVVPAYAFTLTIALGMAAAFLMPPIPGAPKKEAH